MHSFPIPYIGVPAVADAEKILRTIDDAVRAGRRAYVHCWGGHERTGTIAGCWLVRCGNDCARALDLIEQPRRHDPHLVMTPAPQTEDQRAFVRHWGRGAAG